MKLESLAFQMSWVLATALLVMLFLEPLSLSGTAPSTAAAPHQSAASAPAP